MGNAWLRLSENALARRNFAGMKTVIIGASTNPDRAAWQAAQLLHGKGYDFVPVGIKEGIIFGKPVLFKDQLGSVKDVHTVTLYVRPDVQPEWYDAVFALNPKRIIFNPGTENPEFAGLASARGIEATMACSLVLLTTGQY